MVLRCCASALLKLGTSFARTPQSLDVNCWRVRGAAGGCCIYKSTDVRPGVA
jgi:hypothetical protein